MAKNDYPKELYVRMPDHNCDNAYYHSSIQDLMNLCDDGGDGIIEGDEVAVYQLVKVGKLGLSVLEETPKKK